MRTARFAVRFTPAFLVCTAVALVAPASGQASEVLYVPDSTTRICQLTGEMEKTAAGTQPTQNLTGTRAQVNGTDLGFSFDMGDGTTAFLFGDTDALPSKNPTTDPTFDYDSMAFTSDSDPEDCVDLDFVTIGSRYVSPVVPGNHIGHGTFQIPTGGFAADSKMYVFFADIFRSNSDNEQMSVLAVSSDRGFNFSFLTNISTSKFIYISPVTVDNAS